MGASTTQEIAEWVFQTGFDDFDEELVNYAKKLALSQLGMTIAGSVMTPSRQVVSYLEEQGSSNEASVLGVGLKTTAEYAALVNGTMSHATELEDDSFPEGLYTCGIFPAAFALAEKLNLSGRQVIEGFVIGYEVGARLGMECQGAIERGWLNPALWENMGVAAMTAKALGLSVEQITMAMSIAASQAGGIARQTGTGAHLLESGCTGRNGICSAILAKYGFTGNPAILEGPSGFCDLVSGQCDFDIDLGDGYRVMEVGIKKYPCCYLQQRNIDGVLELIREHDIRYEDVESVEHEINYTLSLYLKYAFPENGEDARFSLNHSTAACFLDKNVFLESYTDEKARDPKFREAQGKVKVTVHPEWKPGFFTEPSPVTITLRNGRQYRKICEKAKGDPSLRLNDDEVMKKYMDCMAYAGTFSNAAAEKAAELCLRLEKLKDVSELMQVLCHPDYT